MSDHETENFNFETALAELNQLVEKMEHGNLDLEKSLRDFERGIFLVRQCQDALKKAEQKVEILLKDRLTPYDPEREQAE